MLGHSAAHSSGTDFAFVAAEHSACAWLPLVVVVSIAHHKGAAIAVQDDVD